MILCLSEKVIHQSEHTHTRKENDVFRSRKRREFNALKWASLEEKHNNKVQKIILHITVKRREKEKHCTQTIVSNNGP